LPSKRSLLALLSRAVERLKLGQPLSAQQCLDHLVDRELNPQYGHPAAKALPVVPLFLSRGHKSVSEPAGARFASILANPGARNPVFVSYGLHSGFWPQDIRDPNRCVISLRQLPPLGR
jgi:hypothetical protein